MSANQLLERLALEHPIVQAPMAGVSTPELAAAVSNAGALGSLGVGATDAAGAGAMIEAFRALSSRSLQVNVFCHAPPARDPARERAWIERLTPELVRLGAQPPAELREIYRSFVADPAMLALLVERKPAAVSFHFGLPPADAIAALRAVGIVLLATATNLSEAERAVAAGVHAVVAQGYEAGGHRGVFDPAEVDEQLGTLALTRLLVKALPVPVIAAGGIMDGAGVAAALALGVSAAQLGTAFVGCPESRADAAYRRALADARGTVMTPALSGRPARCLRNRFTEATKELPAVAVPAYPVAYDLGKQLHAAATARGEHGWGAQWAGQGAALSRSLPAGELVARLVDELRAAR